MPHPFHRLAPAPAERALARRPTTGSDPIAPPDAPSPAAVGGVEDETCERCGGAMSIPEVTLTVRGSHICPACLSAWYQQCDDCAGWNRTGDDCPDCDDDLGEQVHSYWYKPAPVFHGLGALFLGLEIEIETPRSRSAAIEIATSQMGGLGYLKSDESIERGFEIVTHPMSYPWALQHFPWTMFTRLRARGCTTTDNLGIHVHLSRAGFSSPGHAFRWMKFVYRNQPHVITLARRTSPVYAAFTDTDRRAVKEYAKGAPSGRYRAINTANPDTFELRIFASSLEERQVQAALAFAAASVEYTRDLSIPAILRAEGWNWSAFTDWLSTRALYEPLVQELHALESAG